MKKMLVMIALMLGATMFAAPAPAQSESSAVREYEEYRRWRDQGHKGDYEDYLEWKRQHGETTARQPAHDSTQTAQRRERDDDRYDDGRSERDDDDWGEDGRLRGDRDDWDDDRDDWDGDRGDRPRRRPPRQPMRPMDLDHRPRLPGHEQCLNHYEDAIMFDMFPCRVVRPCKECGELLTFHAISYEYDKRDLLEDIKYRDEICPRCHEKAELKVSFHD